LTPGENAVTLRGDRGDDLGPQGVDEASSHGVVLGVFER
jgi:hypothetical protein